MSMDQIVYFFLALGMFVGYFAGKLRGEIKQQDLWRNHMEKCSRYMRAVDDLDKWCGHCSPHARLIARHLKAQGEGEGCNSGTPVSDEPCTISGLREQLKRLSQEARLNPDMPTQELRLYMGELTADEVLVARAAIRWANTYSFTFLPLSPPATQPQRAAQPEGGAK